MPYDTTNYIYVHPKAHGQPAYLQHETKEDKTNEQTEILRRNGPVMKSVEAGIIVWRERFMNVGFEPGVKE